MKSKSPIVSCLMLLALFSTQSFAQLNVQAIDVAGDSISKGFNAKSSFPCSNGDEEQYNWLTSVTNSGNSCSAGSENVYSLIERLRCESGTNILAPNPNHAASGAQMLSNFVTQAGNIQLYLSSQGSPRLAVVFLGHNDACSGKTTKTNTTCSNSDQDLNNYCRTKNDSFEREFRKGLDILMTIPNTRIAISAPVRASQLCNFTAKSNCQLFGTCQQLWATATNFGSVFGAGNGICGSLTSDCSNQRIIDTYNTLKAYRDILKQVSAEYTTIPNGGRSRVLTIGGQQVGGALKAFGTSFIYSDAAWFYRFSSNELSCCDCFHPSALGQNTIAKLMKTGLLCSKSTPCCGTSGDALIDGKCSKPEKKKIYYDAIY